MKTAILQIESNAKVNLALDILGVSKSGKFKGYHKIQTIFAEINRFNTPKFIPDKVTIKVSPAKTKASSVKISSNKMESEISAKESPVRKAAMLMMKEAKKRFAIEITIEKNIPISGGLGGGSGNAAAVINGLNELFDLNLSADKRRALAAKVSMDTPFFIEGGIALGENFGEKITKLPPVKGIAFTLFTDTGESSKTKKEFAKLTPAIMKKCGQNTEKTVRLVHSIRTNDSLSLHELLHNDFELLLEKPLRKNIHLTGAGPSRFVLV